MSFGSRKAVLLRQAIAQGVQPVICGIKDNISVTNEDTQYPASALVKVITVTAPEFAPVPGGVYDWDLSSASTATLNTGTVTPGFVGMSELFIQLGATCTLTPGASVTIANGGTFTQGEENHCLVQARGTAATVYIL